MTSHVSDQETGSNQDVKKKEANQSDGKQLLSEEQEEEVSEQQPG